ncbi:hypothetical protein [Sinomicrobium weinanense]|uniref:Uncharacterized protein n=1 Tax=Sinomicrobium weinanense TaxID=2842200 RepID=A0A926JNV6_9FLAO|nr:hypothetical protein [Sinomicrobium weinanense]MBC9794644.1 hypothetical protein [Sinomicrobium weinanense]MBU3124129.1 hypothetical protein [Sinomicrobium weinanense]
MKILFAILLFAVAGRECENRAALQNTGQKENISFQYKALSRGSFYEVVISPETISVQKSRDKAAKTLAKMDDKDWQDLLAVLDKIDVTQIRELKAPTDKRLYDGAAHAELIITREGKAYRTSGFDHGYPPEEVEPLVKTILALAETVEKQ